MRPRRASDLAYLRQRANLVRQASRRVQHMQKALEQLNLKLTEILSDITGVTGRSIIRAILRGTRAPEKLAKYRDKGCKAREAEIAQALTRIQPQECHAWHAGVSIRRLIDQ
jgi:transposase